jgi:serine/threonine-protein kinase
VLRDPERLPPVQIATIGASVAAALAFAHRHSVVHRDVKPGNVLITPDGEVKVTDFGIARAVNTDESLTQTGAVMGTAAYFSPEQAEGKVVDARSDVYSLGVVLYEMCVGKPPFTGDSPVAVASKHVRDTPILPRVANPAVPVALEAVVMKAMAKNPDDRYGSAEEFRADLLRFADGRPVEAADPGVTSMMAAVGPGATTTNAILTTGQTQAIPRVDKGATTTEDDLRRKRRNRWLIALLILLLVALAVLAFFLLRSVGVLGGKVDVPNVVGEPLQIATQTLQNDNLTVGTTTHRADSAIRGTVLSSDPTAGTSVSKGSSVNLVLSAGPNVPIVQVPSVTGQQLSTAIQQLQAAGLTYTVKYTTSNQPEGQVLSQDPAGGSRVRKNIPIALTVSGTQTSVSVPSVLGQSQANAGAILTRAGLTIGTQTSTCSNQVGTGLVADQSPPGGENVKPNTAVNLVISDGSCATVPGVVGQTASSAQASITGAGLTPNTTTDASCPGNAQPGTVDSQNPAAGTQLQPGSTVNISVCQPPTTTTSSTSTTTTSTPAGPAGGGGGGQGNHTPPGGPRP